MKKIIFQLCTGLISLFCVNAFAADLIEVYQQAQISDPIFQQAIAQRLSTREGVPIAASALFPNVSVNAVPTITRTGYSGTFFQSTTGTSANFFSPRNNTQRAYTLTLSLNQTVFDFAQFSAVAGAQSTAKNADATLNAALQDLMVRVANAYFAVLRDEDNLKYSEASKLAFFEQLDQIKQQYKVGLKTITDVYTAQASYDSAVASYIAAQTTLLNDRENLRVITGKYYTNLLALSEKFPLITPHPANVEEWVRTAQLQNWSIKAARYTVDTARHNIRQQFAGHLPTVSAQATMDRIYANNLNRYNNFTVRNGPGTQTDRTLGFNITVPVFSGGGVVAATNQATYDYQVAEQNLEQVLRNTLNVTRQSYLGIVAGISKIHADQQTIKSLVSSMQGLEVSYRVGTETLVDVLNQQQKVFQAQLQYSTDRYAFVNNILALKQAAGTLSYDDLCAINAWLVARHEPKVSSQSLITRAHKLEKRENLV